MTKEEAIALYDSKFWEAMDFEQRATFQLWEDRLCMPFGVFHEAVEKALKRPVYTHEFGLNRDGLKEELLGLRPTPTMDDVLGPDT
jgi:lysozyme family protein